MVSECQRLRLGVEVEESLEYFRVGLGKHEEVNEFSYWLATLLPGPTIGEA